MRDPKSVARVSGYSFAQEYHLDWETRTAMFCQQVVAEARSLSMPTTNAMRHDRTLTLLGDPPERGVTFTIVGPVGPPERHALASGWVQKGKAPHVD